MANLVSSPELVVVITTLSGIAAGLLFSWRPKLPRLLVFPGLWLTVFVICNVVLQGLLGVNQTISQVASFSSALVAVSTLLLFQYVGENEWDTALAMGVVVLVAVTAVLFKLETPTAPQLFLTALLSLIYGIVMGAVWNAVHTVSENHEPSRLLRVMPWVVIMVLASLSAAVIYSTVGLIETVILGAAALSVYANWRLSWTRDLIKFRLAKLPLIVFLASALWLLPVSVLNT